MTATAYPIESHLTPIKAHTFSKDGVWWRAVVQSEDEYGNELVRLYMWREHDQKGWVPKHKWNVQEDRWKREKGVVDDYVG